MSAQQFRTSVRSRIRTVIPTLLFILAVLPIQSLQAYTLPDTGQTKCYDNTNEIPCPNPGEAFYGQDAQYQVAQPAYKDNGDGTVTDLNTGLMWQQGDDQNNGNYTWQWAVDYCVGLNLANHSDWRLPTVEELTSLTSIGPVNPSIDTQYFPQCRSHNYWSSSTYIYYLGSAWDVHFYSGSVAANGKIYNDSFVRCVRGETIPTRNYVDNHDGTVSDTLTGLMWQQGDGQNDQGGRNWEQALAYCEGLNLAGKGDWRLPNYRELASVVDYSRYNPAINPLFSSRGNYYWSSSTYVGYPDDACIVYFYVGDVGAYYKTNTNNYVRCVRSGPSGPFGPLTIAQTPMSGPPGTTFVEWGTDFTPNSTATLHFKKPDLTEYPTRQVDLDSIGHFEITYTAPWNKPPGTYTWWAINDTTGGKSNEVSYVIEGVAGELHHFDITMDGDHLIGNQKVKVAFPIRVQAHDYANNAVTAFNGEVFLSLAGPGLISPNKITVVNGDQSAKVTISEPSEITKIHGQSGTMVGDSNEFSVYATVTVLGSVKSRVIKSSGGEAVEGATVKLAKSPLGPMDKSTQTGSSGFYEFTNVAPGRYYVWATYDGQDSITHSVDVSGNKRSYPEVLVLHSKKRPVLLVPGNPGSDKNWVSSASPYPTLPKDFPAAQDKLHLHDMDIPILTCGGGWQCLKGEIEDHYETYDCPYDWRASLEDPENTYKKYLLPMIKKAKKDTGWEKVDVVAHSMGGLLVRSYIQSEDYANDIEKFVMVGTPNHGSLNAYYMWEGGDPMLADQKGGSTTGWTKWFYSNTANNIYKEMKDHDMFEYEASAVPKKMKISKEDARRFIFDKVTSMRQLMPIFGECLKDGDNTHGVEHGSNKNQWLINLNKDARIDLMKGGYPSGPIDTRIFGNNEIETISLIAVKQSSVDKLYEDGEPLLTKKPKEGDGTVLWGTSAQLEPIDSEVCISGKAGHGQLVGACKGDIYAFLNYGRNFEESAKTRRTPRVGTGASLILGLTLRGQAAPLLINPDAVKCGIDDGTQVAYDAANGCRLVREPEGGGITLDNPADGNYTLVMTGASVGQNFVSLTLKTAQAVETKDFAVFYPGSPLSIPFQLNASAEPMMKLPEQPPKPQNLKAFPVQQQDQVRTKLSWSSVQDAGIVQFKVYARRDDEPLVKLLKTLPATARQYQTTHAWEQPRRLYAVSAVNGEGKESFLSDFVENHASLHADFAASPTSGQPPLPVKFKDSSLGGVTGWLWDFGDNATSTEKNPVHVYQVSGRYTVRLAIQTSDETDLIIKPELILVNRKPLIAEPPVGPTTGKVNKSYQFTAKAEEPDGDPVMYRFNWGDGKQTSWIAQSSVKHQWSKAGAYCVKAQAKDDKGAVSAWSGCANIVIQ
jgi:hypothetical protein